MYYISKINDTEDEMKTEKVNLKKELIDVALKHFSKPKNTSEIRSLIADAAKNDLQHFSLRLYLVASKTATKTSGIKYRVIDLPDTSTGFIDVKFDVNDFK